jgi:hypothetical protein
MFKTPIIISPASGGSSVSPNIQILTPVVVDSVYDLTLSDSFKYIRINDIGAVAVGIDEVANVNFTVGTVIIFEQMGAGVVSVYAKSENVTLNALDNGLSSSGQYSILQVVCVDTNIWTVIGGVP